MITKDIQLAIETLTRGDLVAFPTETVFGLGARSDSQAAVKKIYDLKQRPQDHPLIAHCADVQVALAIAPDVPDYAKKLADAFWPGPMTLIFNRGTSDAICAEALGGHNTVAVRVPSHEIAQQLLAPCGFFVSAPSANKFGRVSPTRAEHVQAEFGDELLILDGEQSQVGLESTIISCVGPTPKILRAGAIGMTDILNAGLELSEAGAIQTPSTKIEVAAPGSYASHYAPSIPVIVVSDLSQIPDENFTNRCAVISFSKPSMTFRSTLVVSSYDEYAHEMYNFFRQAEQNECEKIFAVAPDEVGIGIAINDRLKRASASNEMAN